MSGVAFALVKVPTIFTSLLVTPRDAIKLFTEPLDIWSVGRNFVDFLMLVHPLYV